ncbi:MAG: class I SAM-dependent methyltransferase [Actinomycetota bacterium]|nr:class I SAM-dependent methyltransferase [Actinomycetota bacterium]MDQ5808792.1 class I SAM-dependent methyltransferase [Actinomycetota bacterium]
MSAGEAVLLQLFRRFPPKESIFKAPEGRAETEYAAEDDVDNFRNHFSERYPDLFRDKDVLDLGSGFGGRTVKFLEYGAKRVVGLEVADHHVRVGRRFAEERGVGDRVSFVLGTGEEIPCADQGFDLVVMMDVMEHVIDPAQVLREIHRVLRPGGRVALIFPPYYDVTQGSHLHGYATRLPGLNLVFPTRTLRAATRRHVDEQGVEFDEYFRDVPSDKLWNQNGLTVRRWSRLVADSPLTEEWTYLMGHLQYRRLAEEGTLFGDAKPLYRAAQWAAEAPGLRELTCSRICAVLRRD